MSITDITALAPLIIVGGSAVLIMLTIALRRNHLLTALLAVAGLLLALASLPAVFHLLPRQVTKLLVLDSYAFFYIGLIFSASIATAVFSYGYLKKSSAAPEEFYLLLLLAAFGSALLAAAGHFVSFFLGVEILSISLYALIAYRRSHGRGIGAGIMYLVLAAVSSAFLLFGMALIYYELGTMEFSSIPLLSNAGEVSGIVFLSGTLLVLIGFGFKLAVVPFHLWTPDVYEGAPAPVTGFIATVSKGAVFALFLRYFVISGLSYGGPLFSVFSIIAAVSMVAGNLLALFENNVKRILAYSSISHIGYLLVAFLAGGELAVTAATFYLAAYFVTVLGAFGAIGLLSDSDNEAGALYHFRSLAWERPWMAGVFTVMLLSLAGLPLTAGFIGKAYLIYAGVRSGLWFLVILLVISSAIGLFYYLRVILVMFRQPENAGQEVRTLSPVSPAGAVLLGALTVVVIWLGVYPGPVIQLIQDLITAR